MLVEIGSKIKSLRKRDGRKQEDLANALGVTCQAISRWEAGGGYPDIELIPAIANYFNVSIDELFGYSKDREEKLTIYGPRGLSKVKDAIYNFGYCKFDFPIDFIEIGTEIIEETDEYIIRSQSVRHNVPSLAYSIEEKKKPRFLREKAIELGVPVGPAFGRLHNGEEVEVDGKIIKPEQVLGEPRKGIKITYSGDTRPCEEMIELAKDSTILIHESTFSREDEENALEHGHSTAADAAYIANQSNSKELILTHISTRYNGEFSKILLKEAKESFENTKIAYDFMNIEL